MPSSSPPFRSLLSIIPPELEAIDAAWNDEDPTRPGDPSERVTQVPSMPSEVLAKHLMEEAPSDIPAPEADSDIYPRPAARLDARTLDSRSRGSDAVTYRPPIASALSPGSPFLGRPPEPRIFESDSLELATEVDGTGSFGFSPHEAPTKQGPVEGLVPHWDRLEGAGASARSGETEPAEPDPLELDLEVGASALLRAQEAAQPAQSPMELARRFSSIPARPANPVQDMKDRYAMGDFSGALEVAEKILAGDPDQEEAYRCAQSCRDVLTDMYASRIGGTQQRAVVTMSPDQIRWLSLDHRAGFLLSMIDGVSTVDELLDICGMPRIEALRILCLLLDQHAVVLEP
jgi:hypothetical protein